MTKNRLGTKRPADTKQGGLPGNFENGWANGWGKRASFREKNVPSASRHLGTGHIGGSGLNTKKRRERTRRPSSRNPHGRLGTPWDALGGHFGDVAFVALSVRERQRVQARHNLGHLMLRPQSVRNVRDRGCGYASATSRVAMRAVSAGVWETSSMPAFSRAA